MHLHRIDKAYGCYEAPFHSTVEVGRGANRGGTRGPLQKSSTSTSIQTHITLNKHLDTYRVCPFP